MSRGRSLLLLPILLCLAAGAVRADCSAELAEIDRRIATGRHPEEHVRVARQLRSSIEQMCAMLPAEARASMMEGIEDVLPEPSDAARRTEPKTRAAEQQAERSASGAREARLAPVVASLPAARSVAAVSIARDEPMYYTHAWDWTLHEGRLRLLYTSVPDRSQFARPDWRVHVYVAEMTTEGRVTNRRVLGEQSNDMLGFALRRGHDELFRIRQTPRSEDPRALERWSIPDGRLVASTDLTQVEWLAAGRGWRPPRFQVATADGGLLVAADATTRRVALAWFKLSADARILGANAYAVADSVSPWAWLWTRDGGGGLVVDVVPADGTDLASGLSLPPEYRSLGAMTAHVSRERRVLVVDAAGGLASDGIVIERDLMPLADAVPSGARPIRARCSRRSKASSAGSTISAFATTPIAARARWTSGCGA